MAGIPYYGFEKETKTVPRLGRTVPDETGGFSPNPDKKYDIGVPSRKSLDLKVLAARNKAAGTKPFNDTPSPEMFSAGMSVSRPKPIEAPALGPVESPTPLSRRSSFPIGKPQQPRATPQQTGPVGIYDTARSLAIGKPEYAAEGEFGITKPLHEATPPQGTLSMGSPSGYVPVGVKDPMNQDPSMFGVDAGGNKYRKSEIIGADYSPDTRSPEERKTAEAMHRAAQSAQVHYLPLKEQVKWKQNWMAANMTEGAEKAKLASVEKVAGMSDAADKYMADLASKTSLSTQGMSDATERAKMAQQERQYGQTLEQSQKQFEAGKDYFPNVEKYEKERGKQAKELQDLKNRADVDKYRSAHSAKIKEALAKGGMDPKLTDVLLEEAMAASREQDERWAGMNQQNAEAL